MVAAAYKTGITRPAGMTIYNCCTGEAKPITWGRLVSLAIEKMRIHPLGELLGGALESFLKSNELFWYFQRALFGILREF
jgi:hypothetical protein